jgi:hypothetical protein
MSENVKEMLDDFVVTIELSVKDINVLLNCLNTPHQMPTTTAVYFINTLQNQAGPQVEKARKDLETVSQATKNE